MTFCQLYNRLLGTLSGYVYMTKAMANINFAFVKDFREMLHFKLASSDTWKCRKKIKVKFPKIELTALEGLKESRAIHY